MRPAPSLTASLRELLLPWGFPGTKLAWELTAIVWVTQRPKNTAQSREQPEEVSKEEIY